MFASVLSNHEWRKAFRATPVLSVLTYTCKECNFYPVLFDSAFGLSMKTRKTNESKPYLGSVNHASAKEESHSISLKPRRALLQALRMQGESEYTRRFQNGSRNIPLRLVTQGLKTRTSAKAVIMHSIGTSERGRPQP